MLVAMNTLPRPTTGVRSLRLALAYLAIATAVFVALEIALVVAGPAEPVWAVVLMPLVGALYAAVGLVAWTRRPGNRMGALLLAAASSMLLATLANTDDPVLIAVGLILATAVLAAIVHLLLAFPSGRLRSRGSRAVVIAAYVVAIVLQAPLYLFAPVAAPHEVLFLENRPDLVRYGQWLQRSCGLLVMAVAAVMLAQRFRAASRAQRWVLGPLYVYGATAVLLIPLSATVLQPVFGISPLDVFVCQLVIAALVPIAFAVAMFRGGFARTAEIEELGHWLSADEDHRPALRDALATALGDPSVELVFWAGDEAGYVDAAGRPRHLPTDPRRAVVEVDLAGRRIGAIAYDQTLIADPELVHAAARVVAIALDREQLTARLRANRAALRESRRRIVEAADVERRRIAQDLHDGLQSRLVLLAVEAATADADEVRRGIIAAIDDLRRLLHGVMPPLLIEEGLYAATEDLVDRVPVPTRLALPSRDERLPPALERTAYLVVAEALTNAVKHAHANEIAVTLARADGTLRIEVVDDGVGGATPLGGAGLRNVADRIDAFGGRLSVTSAPGTGTRLVAEVPCAS